MVSVVPMRINHAIGKTSLLACLVFGGPGIATTGYVAAADLVITNARVFTATDAPVLEQASVVITGDRIEAVTVDPVDITGATVIDASGMTVLPGLFDAHLHAFFLLPSLDGKITDIGFPTNDEEAAEWVEGTMQDTFNAYLEQGFTSLVSPIDFWPQILEVREKLAAGELRGPRLFTAGGVFIAPGGHFICGGAAWCNEHLIAEAGSPDEAREWVRRYAESGVDLITHDNLSNPPGMSKETIQAMTEAAHRHGLKVLVTASDASNAADLVAWGIDGYLHPPAGTADTDGSLLASAGAKMLPIAMTLGELEETYRLGSASPEQIQNHRVRRQNVMSLLENGAVPVFASDLGDKPGTTPTDILEIMTRAMTGAGLSREEVLQAATRNAAQNLLGREDLGTLEAGNLADIILVDGDPLMNLDDLANIELVIKNGEVVVDKRAGTTD